MKKNRKCVENRASHRVTVSLPVTYNITAHSFKEQLKIRAIAKDISARGIGFVSSHKPPTLVMNLQIELPEKDKSLKFSRAKFINAKIKIVYSQPISKQHQDILRTGACFVELTKNDAALLRELLEQTKKR